MQKRMKIMLISMGILFGSIFLYKLVIGFIIKRSITNQPHVVTVSTMKVEASSWQPELEAVANIRAIDGVNVTTELAGMVKQIYFKSGAFVNQGDVLVQLNADTEIAQLHSLQANAQIAKITYDRDKAQFRIHAISKQVLDTDEANLKSIEAQVEQQKALIAKKRITAPFSGKLGISNVNPGQFINPGDKVVSLQTLDPIYADFFIPQQQIAKLALDQKVLVTSDTYPSQHFEGKITTIEPNLDEKTRNIAVEATLPNPKQALLPGMFVNVTISTGQPSLVLTLPQTAISFNSYGNLVFVVEKSKDSSVLKVRQHFVITGETRGDQIQILKGLKKGDEVVTTGQLKLKNDSLIAVNNKIQLPNNPSPQLDNNH